MRNKKDSWARFLCWLIGWDYDTLQNCTQASHKALTRYTSALVVMMVIWGFVSFMFTRMYLGSSIFVCTVVSAVFICMVVCIERQIILRPGGKSTWLVIIRSVLAGCMAFIGSIIIDQFLFQDDIEIKKQEIVDKRTNLRLEEYDKARRLQERSIRQEIDSLSLINDSLNEVISLKPLHTQKLSDRKEEYEKDANGQIIRDSLGNARKLVTYDVKTVSVPNPLAIPRDNNAKRIEDLQKTLGDLYDKQAKDIESIRTFYQQKKGFLDEIQAIISTIADNGWAIVVYVLFFVFFLCIELFILVSSSKDCDYNVLVNKREESRKTEIERMFNNKMREISQDDNVKIDDDKKWDSPK